MKEGKSIKKIIISSGYYATNIGNAFYDLGARYVLEKCLGKDFRIILSSDKMKIFWSELLGGEKNAIDHTLYYDADYVILMGPVFSAEYVKVWEPTIAALTKRGTKIVFMSAGASRYNDEEYEEVSSVLRKHNLYALLSRDSDTYRMYKDFFAHSYDGICCATYCCDYAPKYNICAEPYVVLNFDNCKEPRLIRSNDGIIEINGSKYEISKRDVLRRKLLPDRLEGGERIIRTIHTVLPGKKKYGDNGNYFLTDMPYDYLNLYANASAVITNRVHAAVTSMAYGTPVHLTNSTPRGKILNRLNCEDAYRKLITIDKGYLDREKRKLEEQIKGIFI